MNRSLLGASLIAISGTMLSAQTQGPPKGWVGAVDGLYSYQGRADLGDGGSFSANRSFVRAGGLYRFENGFSAGVFASAGQLDYDFDTSGVQPWGDVTDLRVSIPMRYRFQNGVSLFFAPSLRFDYEAGASMSDGRSYGAFAGITWRVNDKLSIGPGFGAFSQFEDDDTQVFAALLIDWDISKRWNLSTGRGLGASQGPGLSLSYAHSDALRFSLLARYEELRFRLDNQGPAPNGVGQDKSIPVVFAVEYNPSPALSLTAFAGAEFNGELQLESSSGAVLSTQNYETAPLIGFAFRLAF